MKLYVASSWKNPLYEPTIKLLNHAGHECLDWKAEGGFRWSDIPGKDAYECDGYDFRNRILNNPVAIRGYQNDYSKMLQADACVILLPCGRSAHLEAGWFAGHNKPLHIYIPVFDTPELMYKMANSINFNMEELITSLRR